MSVKKKKTSASIIFNHEMLRIFSLRLLIPCLLNILQGVCVIQIPDRKQSKCKTFNWTEVNKEVPAGRGEPKRNGEGSYMETVAPHHHPEPEKQRQQTMMGALNRGEGRSQVSFLEFCQCSTSCTVWGSMDGRFVTNSLMHTFLLFT